MDEIELVPMTQPEYDAWLPAAIATYAAETAASGRWTKEEAHDRSREEHERLLPQGLATPNHRLWSITRSSDKRAIGILWIEAQQSPVPTAFIYNIEIGPEYRRRGYARQAMEQLEDVARQLGLRQIRLHVFGHNSAARPLYEKLGYQATNILMAKQLD